MGTVTIGAAVYDELENYKEVFERIRGVYGEEFVSHILQDVKMDKKLDRFIEDLNNILCESEVDYPAGRDCGHSIIFDEGQVKRLLQDLLEEK